MFPERSCLLSGQDSRRPRQYFTLEQANRALVYIRRIVADIRDCHRQALAFRQVMLQMPNTLQSQEAARHFDEALDRLNDLVDELQATGAILRDFETGCVEFPALHRGQLVYLCWQADQERITTWRPANASENQLQDLKLLEQI